MSDGAVATSIVVNGRFLAARATGVQRVARELLRAVDIHLMQSPVEERRLDLTLAAPRGVASESPYERIALNPSGRLTGHFWEQISLPRFAKAQLTLNLCNLAPIWRPGVVMIHDAQVHLSPQSYSRAFVALYKLAQPLIGRRALRVLTGSGYAKAMLVKHNIAPADKITVIHHGVDHMLRVAPDRAAILALGLREGRYVIALANTQAHKNVGVLMAAFADPALADAKLVLVGAATLADFAAAGHACPPNVICAGRVSDAGLRGLLEGAACLAFPSTTEGFGLPPLEAMILGCPAVVAPCGPLPEVCGDAAVYADPHDPKAWAKSIAVFVGDPEARAARGVKAKAHASAFTWARSARRLMQVLADHTGPAGSR